MSFDDQKGMSLAFEQAKKSYSEGGIPIGGALIHKDGTVLAVGHNQRVQKGSATLHGEIDTFEKAGRLRGSVYADCTVSGVGDFGMASAKPLAFFTNI
ncbi:unnamed protein product [Kuraishia capsulata CBS 1993]|uniref:CMP/dCMP-type deaminase domain-containing protein n=1 Tax=Kuraishia capsulata CBS 1993 TaxID=1382522 RepID=W6MGF3_9ASCO|nr:uncharacterized protein KUCA_T00000843001 [Kuraishia capsulata CBS 1993]CDK24876.1 unnamed protein product [Kuraishia capsulata CBS 1993]